MRVWDLHHQLAAQQQITRQTEIRNALLDAEVRDLKQGSEAIEERARSDLGMIKSDEIFFQLLEESANFHAENSSVPVAAASDSSVITPPKQGR